MNLDSVFEKALDSVRNVGDFVASKQHKIKSLRFKDIKDPQTDVDIEAEEKLVKELRNILPEAGFLLEEGITNLNKVYNWVIDPIDGTKLFSTDFPFFFTQIALKKGDDTIFSAIYNPVSKQMFHAVSGKGAYLNGEKVLIKYDGPISSSIANTEIGSLDSEVSLDFVKKLGSKFKRFWIVLGIFSPYLLTNTIQAYIRFHTGKNSPYDLLPRFHIIKEAGGEIHKHNYCERTLYIAAHPKLVAEIEQELGL